MSALVRSALAALALLLVVSACSSVSDDTGTDESAVDVPVEVEPAGEAPTVSSPDERFCSEGNSFVTDTKARLIATPDAETFVEIDAQLGDLAQRSPSEMVDSVAALREGFAAVGEAYADIGYDPGATLTLDPEIQDATALAGSTLRSYLLANCDLAAARDAQIAQIVDAFGIEDEATAECIHAQLGDVANIDSSTLSPEFMTAPVCGTSIIGLLSGQPTDS